MSKNITKSEFEAKALEYLNQVQKTGEPLVITENGKPVLKLVPHTPSEEEALKALRGSVIRYDDPLEPVGVEDWEALK